MHKIINKRRLLVGSLFEQAVYSLFLIVQEHIFYIFIATEKVAMPLKSIYYKNLGFD
jgi:hypothetical protein